MLAETPSVAKERAESPSSRQDVVLHVTLGVLFFICSILSLRFQYLLLNYREWGDESETIVAAKMMASGMRLYSEIFNHHGPLTFLPGIVVEKMGDYGIHGHRVGIALLQIVAAFALYKTPIIKNFAVKLTATAISMVIVLVFMPDMFAHMYKYQTIAGIFLVVILAQYTIPAIFCPVELNPLRVVLGNILIASLPFLAITYLPVAGLLFVASLRRPHLKYVTMGCSAGVLTNLIFLGVCGSYAGFLAFHLYLNGKVLPLYGARPGGELVMNALRVVTSDLTHFLSLVVILCSAFRMAVKEVFFPWRTVFLLIGLGSLLIRGAGFHGMPYFYALLPFFAVLLRAVDVESRSFKYVAIGILALCALKISLVLPGEEKRLRSAPIPKQTDFSRWVREFTTKEDRIIAYSFQNFQYLASDRLPASGHFFYLPWQEKYNESPRFGIAIDACQQIRQAAPKIMLVDKWLVWDRYPWDSYGGCVQKFLDTNYVQVPDRPYYIRKDLVGDARDFFVDSAVRKMTPSLPLDTRQTLQLKFFRPSGGLLADTKLVGLAVMFGTYDRVNPGAAQLALKRADGSTWQTDFFVADIHDNEYAYFEVPEDRYVTGEIAALTGGGISAWESRGEDYGDFTCMKFFFSDGRRGFTPGCPIF